jgi:hypothetical protein
MPEMTKALNGQHARDHQGCAVRARWRWTDETMLVEHKAPDGRRQTEPLPTPAIMEPAFAAETMARAMRWLEGLHG